MATIGSRPGLLQYLRARLRPADGTEQADGELLEEFVRGGDPSALELLVRRHGPMVWGVCRRILGDDHDAEDAFQAAFLVLVRRAASIVPREMVGNWLYGVAYQTARKARAVAARRKGREKQVAAMPEPARGDPAPAIDLRAVLDQELSRLPDRYRAVVVLCDLEGKTRAEAARELGLPEGTVASRQARGRALLADRLTGRGVALSSSSLVVALGHNAASAGVPPALLASTTQAVFPAGVVALAEAVLTPALTSRLRAVLSLLLGVGLLGIGAAVASLAGPTRQVPPPVARPLPFRTDADRLSGDWRTVRVTVGGEVVTFKEGKGPRYRFAGDTVTVAHLAREGEEPARRGPFGGRGGPLTGLTVEGKLALFGQFGGRGGPWAGLGPESRLALGDRVELVPGESVQVAFDVAIDEEAKTIDRRITVGGVEKLVVRGVYRLRGDALWIWEAPPMRDRPTAEQVRSGEGCTLWVFERAAPR